MPPPTPDQALDQLHELMHRYRAQMHGLAREVDDGLAPMEARALGFFARHPEATSSDLVAHAHRDKAQVTRLVKLLESRGLLESVADPADRRTRRLRLTEAGRSVQRRMVQQRKRLAERLVAGFSEPELSQLLGLLQRLQDNFGPPEEAGEPARPPDQTR
jgi:DNA-binding MarR family transcriptional regulator